MGFFTFAQNILTETRTTLILFFVYFTNLWHPSLKAWRAYLATPDDNAQHKKMKQHLERCPICYWRYQVFLAESYPFIGVDDATGQPTFYSPKGVLEKPHDLELIGNEAEAWARFARFIQEAESGSGTTFYFPESDLLFAPRMVRALPLAIIAVSICSTPVALIRTTDYFLLSCGDNIRGFGYTWEQARNDFLDRVRQLANTPQATKILGDPDPTSWADRFCDQLNQLCALCKQQSTAAL